MIVDKEMKKKAVANILTEIEEFCGKIVETTTKTKDPIDLVFAGVLIWCDWQKTHAQEEPIKTLVKHKTRLAMTTSIRFALDREMLKIADLKKILEEKEK